MTHVRDMNKNFIEFCYRGRIASISIYISPPFVRPDIRGSSKPGVKDEDAPEGLASPDSPQQSGIVTEPQTLPEPMDAVLPSGDFTSLTFHFWAQLTC